MRMSDKELLKELSQKHKQLAELQEETANLEDLLPEKDTSYPAQRGYSVIYGDAFKEIMEQLSKGEIKVLWCVKEKFDKHPASKTVMTEVSFTAESIRDQLKEEGKPLSLDNVRKALKKLVDVGFIRPMSTSSKGGKRSTYRMNPFVASGIYAEPIGKLQKEWKMLFP